MKFHKLFATTLIFTMLSTTVAFANDGNTTAQPNTPPRTVTYSLDDVKKLVQANASIKDNYQLQKDMLTVSMDQVAESLDSVEGETYAQQYYKDQMAESEKVISDPQSTLEERQEAAERFREYQSQYEISKALGALNYGGDTAAASDSLNASYDSLASNKRDVNRMIKDLPIDLELTATYLYLNILELEDTSALLDANLALIQKNKIVVELQQSMGMATAQNMDQITLSLNQLVASKNNVNAGLSTLKRLLNNLMGNELDMDFKLADYSLSVEKVSAPIITEEIIKTTLKNSLSYEQKTRTYDTAKSDLKDAKNDTASNDTTIQTLTNDATSARLEMESEEVSVRNTLNNKRNNIIAAENAYTNALIAHDTAQKSLTYSRLRYDLGLISALQLQNEQATALDKENALTAATNDYYFALKDYELYTNGTVTSLYDSLRSSM